jgi:ABC-type sugar transport system ATPase subunit
LRTSNLTKWFGTTRALDGVDFTLSAGESVAILGENGAGKSTFTRVLAGVVVPDAGEIELLGRSVHFSSPRDSLLAGLAYIPQELSYVPGLTVAENLVLGMWPGHLGVTSRRTILKRAREIIDEFGVDLPLRAAMSDLRLSDIQEVEIAKALARQAKVILLDEPTAALSQVDAERLFGFLRRLNERGVGVIFVSHRLDEVKAFSHRVCVFRNGSLVANVDAASTSRSELVSLMLGQRETTSAEKSLKPESTTEVARLEHWSLGGIPSLSDVSLSVHAAEVVGVYGLRGSGATIIGEGLAGESPQISGALTLGGRQMAIPKNPRASLKARVGYVPPDRRRGGLFLEMSMKANVSMASRQAISRRGVIWRKRESERAEAAVRELDVRLHSINQPVGTLSGGNQQKVMIASRLALEPELLVLQEPTRGVDIGARLEIHRLIRRQAGRGVGVIFITSDIEEAVELSDRLIVIRDGRIAEELNGDRLTQSEAAAAAGGALAASGVPR